MREVTIHHPQVRCGGPKDPPCQLNHFVLVPAIELRGTWRVSEMVSDETFAELAVLYGSLEKTKHGR